MSESPYLLSCPCSAGRWLGGRHTVGSGTLARRRVKGSRWAKITQGPLFPPSWCLTKCQMQRVSICQPLALQRPFLPSSGIQNEGWAGSGGGQPQLHSVCPQRQEAGPHRDPLRPSRGRRPRGVSFLPAASASFRLVPAPLIDKQGPASSSAGVLPFTLISPGRSAASINLLRPPAGPLPRPVCQAGSRGFCDVNTARHLRSRFSAPGESCHTDEGPQGSPAQKRLLVLGPHRKSCLCPGVVPTERGRTLS